MDQDAFLALARQFMSLPTAPFHEHWVIAAVEDFAAARPALRRRHAPRLRQTFQLTSEGERR